MTLSITKQDTDTVDSLITAITEHAILLMTFSLSCIFLCSLFGEAYFSQLSKIPGPIWAKFGPFYRIFLIWSGDCGNIYNELHRNFGIVVRTGSKHVVISEPSAIQTIYGRGAAFEKSGFYQTFDVSIRGRMQKTIFSARSHEDHKQLLSHMTGYFTPNTLKHYEEIIDTQIRAFISQMRSRAGQRIDFGDWIRYWSLDINSCFAFGHSLGFLEKGGDINYLITSVDEAFHIGALLGMVPRLSCFVFANQAIMKAGTWMTGKKDASTCIVETIENAVTSAEAKAGPRPPCILTWLREKQKLDIDDLDHHTLIGHLANYLLAGSVSSAAIVSAAIYFCIKSPAAYQRLVSEVRSNEGELDNGHFTLADTQKMPYLQAVVKESLRLVPSNTIPLERVVPETGMTVNGHFVPQGTNVGISAYVIHRNKEIYGDDADEFRPERWIDADCVARARMQKYFFSFSRGERGCNARPVGLMMITKFLAQILRELDVEWNNPVKDTWDLKTWWMPHARGLYVRFRDRSES